MRGGLHEDRENFRRSMMKIEDLTLRELIESAKDSNVSITLTMEPDRAEIQVEPWKPTYSETKWETR